MRSPRSWSSSLFFVVVAGCAAAPVSSPVPQAAGDAGVVSELVASGRAACAAKEWAVAIERLDRALQARPDDVEALRWRGHAHTGAEHHDAALLDLARALRLGADDAWTHYAHAMALHNTGRLEEALAGYTQALAIDPNFVKAHEWRGFTLARLGRSLEALPDLDVALRIDLGNPWLHAIRGKARAALLDFAGAEQDLWRAVDGDANNADAVAQLGYLKAVLGETEAAIVQLQRAVQLDRLGQAEARPWLFHLLREAGRADEAQAELHALRAATEHADAWLPTLAGFLAGDLAHPALLAAAAAPARDGAADERAQRRLAAWLHRGRLAEHAGETGVAIDAFARALASERRDQWEWALALHRLGRLTGERASR